MTRIPAAAFLAFVFAVPATAQDDPDYAFELARHGWLDMADEVCGRILRSASAAPDLKGAATLVTGEIRSAQASQSRDLADARRFLDDAIGLHGKFLKAFPTHTLAFDLRASVAGLKARMGHIFAEARERETDQAVALGNEAVLHFKAAEKDFDQIIADLEKIAQPSDDHTWLILDSKLRLASTLLEHARLAGIPPADRGALLTSAIQTVSDLLWEPPGVINLRANLLTGLGLTELGQSAEAEARLMDASFGFRKQIKRKPGAEEQRLIEEAAAAIADHFNRDKKPREAVALIDRAIRDLAPISAEGMGLFKLRRAEALFQLNEIARAIALATEVQRSHRRLAALANRRVVEWSARLGGSSPIFAEQMMTSAETSMAGERYRDALIALRRCLEAIGTAEQRGRLEPRVLYAMGLCFEKLDRTREAASSFERLLSAFGDHDLAPSACGHAIVCMGREAAVSGDPRDGELKTRLLNLLATAYKDSKEAAEIAYFAARDAEDSGDHARAAELYLRVDASARAHETALVFAARCTRRLALETYDRSAKDDPAKAEAKAGLTRAADLLATFLKRLADPALVPVDPEAAQARPRLASSAFELAAMTLIHELTGRAEETPGLLTRWAKAMDADDPRQARRLALEVEAFIALDRLDDAVRTLDTLLDRFPDGNATARWAKSVADRLDEATVVLRRNKGEEVAIKANLRRVARYYLKWFHEIGLGTPRAPAKTTLDVANRLYLGAREINGLGENVVSFVEVENRKAIDPAPFLDASFVLAALGDPTQFPLDDANRVAVMTLFARCSSFRAGDAKGWADARTAYRDVLSTFKAWNADEVPDGVVMSAHPMLLDVFIELGHIHLETARLDFKRNGLEIDSAATLFSRALGVLPKDSERWWKLRYAGLHAVFERGVGKDIERVRAGLSTLEISCPDFDGGKFGMKERFVALRGEVDRALKGR